MYKSKIFTGRTPEECYEEFSKWLSDYTPVDDKFWTKLVKVAHWAHEYQLTVIYHNDPIPHM